jgi:hypothetical protein
MWLRTSPLVTSISSARECPPLPIASASTRLHCNVPEGYLLQLNDSLSVLRLYSVELNDDNWMMDWKGSGRKRLWTNLKYYPVVSWGTEEKHETPQSGEPMSGPRFETGTSRIGTRIVNHSTTTFGQNGVIFKTMSRVYGAERFITAFRTASESILSSATTPVHIIEPSFL